MLKNSKAMKEVYIKTWEEGKDSTLIVSALPSPPVTNITHWEFPISG
jgi:hypothetical protein